MKRFWLASGNILWILLFAAAVEGLVWLALNLTTGEMIVPQPKTVAKEFSAALAAHRWNGALELLSQDTRQQVREEDLRSLMEQIEQSRPEIEQVNSQSEQKRGNQATAVTEFVFRGQTRAEVEYNLVRENHEWKIASFAGLRTLAGR